MSILMQAELPPEKGKHSERYGTKLGRRKYIISIFTNGKWLLREIDFIAFKYWYYLITWKYLIIILGMMIYSRLQGVEVVQMEGVNALEGMNMSLEDVWGKHGSLLNEHSQVIKLSQIIYPDYDASNEYWKSVHELSNEIKEVKQEKDELQKKEDDTRRNNLRKWVITDNFLTSATKNNKTKVPPSITTSTSP